MPVSLRIDESVVAACWERQHFPSSAVSALGFRVLYRGVPSDAGGPDYQDVRFAEPDASIVTGDVEFHVRASDWYRHGHHENRAYNRVILHVVWSNDVKTTRRADGCAVPVLELNTLCAQLPAVARPNLAPASCAAACADLTSWQIRQIFAEAGVQRFKERSERFAADADANSPDQAAYGGLLEGLGYASNRSAFRALADAVPYAWLMSVDVSDRTSTLLAAAGFESSFRVRPPAFLAPDSWRLSRLRPANHPVRRLCGMVSLLGRMRPTLGEALIDAVQRSEHPSDLRRRLVVTDDKSALIGQGRADELAVSVVLPLVAALDPADTRALWLYGQYPSPPKNHWTRSMLRLLEQSGHGHWRINGAAEHQGMHHVYHSFCRLDRSDVCPVCRPAATLVQP